MLRDVRALEIAVVDLADRGANQLPRDGVAALQLALVFELQLAGDRGQRRVEIQDSRHRHRRPCAFSARRSAFDTTFSSTEIGSRCETPDRLSMRLSSRARNASCSTTSLHVIGHAHLDRRRPLEPRLLLGDRDALFDRPTG